MSGFKRLIVVCMTLVSFAAQAGSFLTNTQIQQIIRAAVQAKNFSNPLTKTLINFDVVVFHRKIWSSQVTCDEMFAGRYTDEINHAIRNLTDQQQQQLWTVYRTSYTKPSPAELTFKNDFLFIKPIQGLDKDWVNNSVTSQLQAYATQNLIGEADIQIKLLSYSAQLSQEPQRISFSFEMHKVGRPVIHMTVKDFELLKGEAAEEILSALLVSTVLHRPLLDGPQFFQEIGRMTHYLEDVMRNAKASDSEGHMDEIKEALADMNAQKHWLTKPDVHLGRVFAGYMRAKKAYLEWGQEHLKRVYDMQESGRPSAFKVIRAERLQQSRPADRRTQQSSDYLYARDSRDSSADTIVWILDPEFMLRHPWFWGTGQNSPVAPWMYYQLFTHDHNDCSLSMQSYRSENPEPNVNILGPIHSSSGTNLEKLTYGTGGDAERGVREPVAPSTEPYSPSSNYGDDLGHRPYVPSRENDGFVPHRPTELDRYAPEKSTPANTDDWGKSDQTPSYTAKPAGGDSSSTFTPDPAPSFTPGPTGE